MILTFEDLRNLRRRVTMVDGGFDPLHEGHIRYFRAAAALGQPVLCSVTGDHYITTKHTPLLPQTQRLAILDAIRYIDYVYLNTGSTVSALDELQPKYYAKGKDWDGRLPREEIEICEALKIEIVFLDTMYDSSTKILRNFLGQGLDYDAD